MYWRLARDGFGLSAVSLLSVAQSLLATVFSSPGAACPMTPSPARAAIFWGAALSCIYREGGRRVSPY